MGQRRKHQWKLPNDLAHEREERKAGTWLQECVPALVSELEAQGLAWLRGQRFQAPQQKRFLGAPSAQCLVG